MNKARSWRQTNGSRIARKEDTTAAVYIVIQKCLLTLSSIISELLMLSCPSLTISSAVCIRYLCCPLREPEHVSGSIKSIESITTRMHKQRDQSIEKCPDRPNFRISRMDAAELVHTWKPPGGEKRICRAQSLPAIQRQLKTTKTKLSTSKHP